MASPAKKPPLWSQYDKWHSFDEFEDEDERPPVETSVEEAPFPPPPGSNEGIVPGEEVFIEKSDVTSLRKLEQKDKTVWQIVCRELNVWSASSKGADDGEEAIPCRPYCVLVANLFPTGRVMNNVICFPPEEPPKPEFIVKVATDMMKNPPDGDAQSRPSRITFSDPELVALLFKTFELIGVRCDYLSDADGISSFLEQYSQKLIKQDIANRGECSTSPGMLSVPRMTPEIAGAVFNTAVDFYTFRPWTHLGERQALELRIMTRLVPSSGGFDSLEPEDAAWVSILGHSYSGQEIKPGERPPPLGYGLFFSTEDLENRLLEGEPPCTRPSKCQQCCWCGKMRGELGKKLKRCTRCKSVLYCSVECQRKHWTSHKSMCKRKERLARGKKKKSTEGGEEEIVWAKEECSMLYEHVTFAPFADMDAQRAYVMVFLPPDVLFCSHGWKDAPNVHAFPMPLQFEFGNRVRPSVKNMLWMEIVNRLFPQLMQDEAAVTVLMSRSMFSVEGTTLDVECHCGTVTVFIRNSTILTPEELRDLEHANINASGAPTTETTDDSEEVEGE